MSDAMAMVVLTSKPIAVMVEEGGCGYWTANEKSVLKCRYVVATVNSRAWRASGMEHGTAFMIAEIAGVAHNEHGRVLVKLSRYKEINIPKAWIANGSNPVRYQTLRELHIEQKQLTKSWKEWPKSLPNLEQLQPRRLTIAEAKAALAETFGVTPEQVEISIKA